MAGPRKLGRGLTTLIPTSTSESAPAAPVDAPAPEAAAPKPSPAPKSAPSTNDLPESALRDVPTSAIEANPNQPRVHFDEDSLRDLANSIKEIGVLQPLLVQEIAPGKYRLIAGERRWRAAQRANLKMVPVVVREINQLQSVEQALVENLHRQDLTALEEASAYQQLMHDFDLTQEQVAKRVGKSRPAVANALRLLTLPAAIQGYLADGRLSAGHARALLGLSDPKAMESLASVAVKEGWSVRATEEAVKAGGVAPGDKAAKPGDKDPKTGLRPAGILELENLLAEYLDTKVSVSVSGKRGRIGIDFADLTDLERIYRRMTEGLE